MHCLAKVRLCRYANIKHNKAFKTNDNETLITISTPSAGELSLSISLIPVISPLNLFSPVRFIAYHKTLYTILCYVQKISISLQKHYLLINECFVYVVNFQYLMNFSCVPISGILHESKIGYRRELVHFQKVTTTKKMTMNRN